jgi:hypothetical protein
MIKKNLLYNHDIISSLLNIIIGINLSLIAGVALIISTNYLYLASLSFLSLATILFILISLYLNRINVLTESGLIIKLGKFEENETKDTDSKKPVNYSKERIIIREKHVNEYTPKISLYAVLGLFFLLLGIISSNEKVVDLNSYSDQNKSKKQLEQLLNNDNDILKNQDCIYKIINKLVEDEIQKVNSLKRINEKLYSSNDSLERLIVKMKNAKI